MKKILLSLAGLLVATCVLAETDYIALPQIQDIRKGVDNENQIETLRVSGNATIGGTLTPGRIVIAATNVTEAAIVQSAWAQSDTNATTTTTLYTPQHIGDILIGLSGSTNYIWIARGTTTNDWQVIAP